MKKIKLLLGVLTLSSFVNSQTNPQGNPPANNTNARAKAAWYRGGNNFGQNNPPGANIFGTMWNSPIFTYTNGVARMKLNGNLNTTINQFSGFRNGYLLLGTNANSLSTGQNLYNNLGAFSRFHINGSTGNTLQEYGYRPWMQTGITLTDNSDMSYIGLRKLSTNANELDITETVFLWSDNADNNDGPDKMVFRFSGYGGRNGNAVSSNLRSTTDLDALHVAQFTGLGLMGLGNTFGTNATGMSNANYVDPQSLMHISYDRRPGNTNEKYGFMQITYRTNLRGGGETSRDGLRLGIDNQRVDNGLNAYLRWQEQTPFIIQTDWNNNPGGIQNGERLRVSNTGYLSTIPGYLGINPNNGNTTRLAISHNGAQPIKRPMSTLHIGYDLNSGFFGNTADGWRDWMDVGTFTSQDSDNMYVGLKNEGSDRKDAVINWGDNQPTSGGNGPDHLRFIFTSTTTSPGGNGDPASTSNDGLEITRMDPQQASTLTDNYGMVGIGNYAANGPNTAPADVINAKLDIDGDLRIRQVNQNDTLTKVLVIDSTDHNRVYWRTLEMPISCWDLNGNGIKDTIEDINGDGMWDALDCQFSGSSSIYAQNALVMANDSTVQFGSNCNDTLTANLLFDTQIDMANYNMYWERNDQLGKNHFSVGYPCNSPLPGKISALQIHPASVNQNTTAMSGFNLDVSSVVNTTYSGVRGEASGTQTLAKVKNIGGDFTAFNSPNSIGINAIIPVSGANTDLAIGGNFQVAATAGTNRGVETSVHGAGTKNTGVFSAVRNGTFSNVGGKFIATGNATSYATGVSGSASNSAIINIGGSFWVTANTNTVNIGCEGRTANQSLITYPNQTAIGIYGNSALSGTTNIQSFAGYFDGNVFINGPANGTGFATVTSDIQFKTEVDSISNAKSILSQLNPSTFYFDTLNTFGLAFSNKKQYGLIAQEVETVLPELITNLHKPETVDSTGTVVTQGVDYKSLNYNAFIAILIKANQEQQEEIDSISIENDSLAQVVTDLNDRLTTLENCLGNLLPLLCQINNSMVEQNGNDAQEQLRSIINVELENGENIVLNQNVPNPFAEQTVITYSIPSTVQEAQIVFYDMKGIIIKTVNIDTRGQGQLNVYGSDLSRGLYTYTLIADGQVIATKKMVKH